jgi:EAL domain-containing protein (putative c-di-GMP-specific phosphodiesterase class I)
VLAEGIETEAEFLVLKATGIRLFQGYWFAKPAFEELPQIRSGSFLDRV